MPLNVIRYADAEATRWGVLRGDRITPVPSAAETTGAFIAAHPVAELAALTGPTVPRAAVALLSPVTRDQQLICQGANYRQHMIESGLDPDAKAYNMFFRKASSCIVPADSDVVRPAHVRFLDYEIELGLVMRRAMTGPTTVTDDTVLDWVAGLVIVNDYSARGVQIPQMQFYKGKSYRTFGPVGPHVCLLEPGDEAQLGALHLELAVNGELRQKDTTASLVYGPAETLTELSGLQDLAPGDLISTGTPAGCALAVPSKLKQRLAALLPEARKWAIFAKVQAKRSQYLQPGDVVEARIRSADGAIDLGVQRNRIVAG